MIVYMKKIEIHTVLFADSVMLETLLCLKPCPFEVSRFLKAASLSLKGLLSSIDGLLLLMPLAGVNNPLLLTILGPVTAGVVCTFVELLLLFERR